MEALIVVLMVALLALVGFGIWALSSRRPAIDEAGQRLEQQLVALKGELSQALSANQQTVLTQVNAVDQRLNERLDAVHGTLGQSLTSNQDTMKHVSERLGQLSQSTQQMLDVGRDIASLQEILRPPKVRGGFGELLLEQLLEQVLPGGHCRSQYRFRSGVQVDAVIQLGGGLVPIDSKFPLEAFHRMLAAPSDEERAPLRREFVRAVKGHIDSVTKYILPDEGTLPFALMYIPAENVFYEVIVRDDALDGQGNLATYALERRVIPVSPSSFYAYLQSILLGLRGMQVEERAHEIIRHLEQLTGDFSRIRKDYGTLGEHLKNASNKYSEVDRAVSRFGDRLALSIEAPRQPSLLERPEIVNGASAPAP